MFLFFILFIFTMSSCVTIEAGVPATATAQQDRPVPYYTNSQYPTAKSYIRDTKESYTPRSNSNSPLSWPLIGKIIDNYGQISMGTRNKGVDILSTATTSVKAAGDGKVVFSDRVKGWGKTMVIAHHGNMLTIYANLASTGVREGDYVRRGQTIAKVSEPKDGGSILHFEVRKDHLPQNPLKFLN